MFFTRSDSVILRTDLSEDYKMFNKLKLKAKALVLFITLTVLTFVAPLANLNVCAASTTITTTLTDGALQKGSKKTFDVVAHDGNGNKITSSVTFNGASVTYNWDDSDKTSYTLSFTQEGLNTVVVSAGDVSQSYTLIYQKANKGDVIGQAIWSVELFTIGCGYLVEPIYFDIREGETSATELLRLLHRYGYVGYYGGTPENSFYLAYVGDGNKTKKFQNRTNSSTLLGMPDAPKNLNLNPEIPDYLYSPLQTNTTFFDAKDYANWTGYIGEFVFTNGSGWMYSVNNVFPNVGFADSYLSDGDVIRVQFTLCYGADIGGSGSGASGTSIPDSDFKGGDFYSAANKDRLISLTVSAAENGKKNLTAYMNAISVLKTSNATQSQVDNAYSDLKAALNSTTTPTTSTPVTSEATISNTITSNPSTNKSEMSTSQSSSSSLDTDMKSSSSTESGNSTNSALAVTNLPFGSTVTEMPNGSIVTSTSDGKIITEKKDGTVITQKPGGTVITANPDGTVVTEMPDGTVIKENSDGTVDVKASEGENVLFDKNSRILVSGVPDYSQIQVRIPNEKDDELLFTELKTVSERFWGYDINLLNENNEEIQLKQRVSVRIPLPNGIKKNIAFYSVNKESGKLILTEFRIEDDMLVFETNHLGMFALIEVFEQSKANLSTNFCWVIPLIVIVVLFGVGICFWVVKMKHRKTKVEK